MQKNYLFLKLDMEAYIMIVRQLQTYLKFKMLFITLENVQFKKRKMNKCKSVYNIAGTFTNINNRLSRNISILSSFK